MKSNARMTLCPKIRPMVRYWWILCPDPWRPNALQIRPVSLASATWKYYYYMSCSGNPYFKPDYTSVPSTLQAETRLQAFKKAVNARIDMTFISCAFVFLPFPSRATQRIFCLPYEFRCAINSALRVLTQKISRLPISWSFNVPG